MQSNVEKGNKKLRTDKIKKLFTRFVQRKKR